MLDGISTAEGDHTPGEMLAWRVEGMDCASCVAKVRTAVERPSGVSGVEVSVMIEGGTVPALVEH